MLSMECKPDFPCCLSPMIAPLTGSPQKSPNASQVKKLIARLEATALQSPPSATSPLSPGNSPRRQPQTDVKFGADHSRRASITSQSSLDTLKIESEVSPDQDIKQAEDELPARGPRESAPTPSEG